MIPTKGSNKHFLKLSKKTVVRVLVPWRISLHTRSVTRGIRLYLKQMYYLYIHPRLTSRWDGQELYSSLLGSPADCPLQMCVVPIPLAINPGAIPWSTLITAFPKDCRSTLSNEDVPATRSCRNATTQLEQLIVQQSQTPYASSWDEIGFVIQITVSVQTLLAGYTLFTPAVDSL